MHRVLYIAIASLIAVIISAAYPSYVLYQNYQRYNNQIAQFKEKEAILTAKEAVAIDKLCAEYKKWQFYMLVHGHSVNDYTTSMDKRCYGKSSN